MASSVSHMKVHELADHFLYLDNLRESGVTNMFGAGHYLQHARSLSETDARIVLLVWMDTFDGELSTMARARAAIAKAEGRS